MKQLLFCGTACMVATLGTAAKQQTDTVPFYLVAAAQRPFAEFMFQVANASVRAGIELKDIDNAAVSRAPARPRGETKQVPRCNRSELFWPRSTRGCSSLREELEGVGKR